MKFQTISLTLTNLSLLVKAVTWKFHVVSIMEPSYRIGLKYENKIVNMQSQTFPVFTTSIDSGSSKTYKYVVLDNNGRVVSEEGFERNYTDEVATINEVYNSVEIKSLPQVYKSLFKNGTNNYKDYEDNQIYTVYAKCDENAYQYLKYNPFINHLKNDSEADCNVTFVTKTNIYQRTGKLQLIGFDSRRYKKLSWKIKLDKKVLGRKTIKFRGGANDPTLMRDKISTELYKAVGVPTYSSAYARVMINNDIYGLYSIVDSVNGKWIASIVHGDDDAHTGTSYKTYAGASLKYLGEGQKSYVGIGSYELDEVDPTDKEANGDDWYRLVHFTKLFQDWNTTFGNDQSFAAVEALEKFFNLESLLRQMVIESLTFAYDNFWANSGNFALYYNPEQNKYQIIPYDFDGTFYGSMGSERFKKYYNEDINNCINWADVSRKDKDTYFISSLFKHDLIKNRYNEIMKETVNKLFNVDSISPLIDSLSTLIEEDVEWNSGLIDKLDSSITGYVNHFTLENFKGNTNFKMVDYNPKLNYNDANFGIKKWIQLRGNQCKKYVKNVTFMTTKQVDPTSNKLVATKSEYIPVVTKSKNISSVNKTNITPIVIKTTETPVVNKTTNSSVAVKTNISPVIVRSSNPKIVKTNNPKVTVKKNSPQIIFKTINTPVVTKITNKSIISKSVNEAKIIKTINTSILNRTTTIRVPIVSINKAKSTTSVINRIKKHATTTYQIKKSTNTSQVRKPTTTNQIRKPTTTSQVRKPTTTSQVRKSTTTNQIRKPTTTSQVRKPTTTNQVRKPTTTNQIRKPTTTNQVRKPTTINQVKKPTIKAINNIKISNVAGRCGPKYGRCQKSTECCSKFGYCGKTNEFCKFGCLKAFGACL
ncbi:carbohydrate-binding module family 18 protein [Piromyces sp. E2]|nr:carbohydrate-binding module family 18 protein [Piromyces sp. E2]|eukprot:OUM61114.1 carbohydrate-binding module family 18 protein [Piromyces sp. E2]